MYLEEDYNSMLHENLVLQYKYALVLCIKSRPECLHNNTTNNILHLIYLHVHVQMIY